MVTPTAVELGDFSLACQRLWSLDHNRLEPGRDYKLDLQRTRRQIERTGPAGVGKLFSYMSPEVFKRPTYMLFYNLLDNYKHTTGAADSFGPKEQREMSDFLDACMQTAPMQYVHQILVAKNMMGSSPQDWKNALHKMWFAQYRREVQNDSSGFEHTFVGEVDQGVVKGLHNWIQLYMEEGQGNLKYLGYMNPRQQGGGNGQANADDRMLSIHFTWLGAVKEVSSVMLGSSPEFELALYTLCFVGGTEQNNVHLGGWDMLIKAYKIRTRDGQFVGSCFPEIQGRSGPDTRPQAGTVYQPEFAPQTPARPPQSYPASTQQHGNGPSYAAATAGATHGVPQQQQQQQQYHAPPPQQGRSLLDVIFDILGSFCGGGAKNQR